MEDKLHKFVVMFEIQWGISSQHTNNLSAPSCTLKGLAGGLWACLGVKLEGF